jgi:GntR family transcriptional regulator, transcriptional repressor for pyruvate dehydrogenase complex
MRTDPPNEADFEALLSPAVRTRSLDDVVDKLRGILLSGALQPDQKLPSERALSRMLEVSRTTVREALRNLEAQGLVQIRVGGTGGAFFKSPDPGLVGSALSMLLMFESVTETDLHEYRFDFEQENAELAAVRATDEQRAQLQEMLDQARRLRDDESADPLAVWPAVEELDLRVHELLPEMTHNAVRVAISRGIHDALKRSFEKVEPQPDSPQKLAAEVIELLELLVAGKGPEARQAMSIHLRQWWS